MKRTPIAILSLAFLVSCFIATPPVFPLSSKNLIRQIEARQNQWMAFKAALRVRFISEEGGSARCQGELFYQRLDEKILFRCFNAQKELLFVFKTDDMRFELYVPGQETLFRGNIFDAETSSVLDSHLKPLAFYRALKPMVIPYDQVEFEPLEDPSLFRLNIYDQKRDLHYLAREMTVTNSGDVLQETYFTQKGKPWVEISRSGFEVSAQDAGIVFPRQIRLQTKKEALPKEGTQITGWENKWPETELFFEEISFVSSLKEDDWLFQIPPGTKIATLGDGGGFRGQAVLAG